MKDYGINRMVIKGEFEFIRLLMVDEFKNS